MAFNNEKSILPVGKTDELKARREVLPAVEVKNTVLWENTNLNYPFKLVVGSSAKLGLFLHDNPGLKQPTKNLETAVHHNRSILLGRIIFSEKAHDSHEQLQLFREIGRAHV